MNKGDVVLVPFPFTDLTKVKRRPALVLVVGELDVTVSFITTQLKWQETNDLMIDPKSDNGLKSISLIKLTKLATIDKDLVIGKLGSLSDSEISIVNRSLIRIFKLQV